MNQIKLKFPEQRAAFGTWNLMFYNCFQLNFWEIIQLQIVLMLLQFKGSMKNI